MELYAANNAVTATHAFSPLDELPKLYVADFRGNITRITSSSVALHVLGPVCTSHGARDKCEFIHRTS